MSSRAKRGIRTFLLCLIATPLAAQRTTPAADSGARVRVYREGWPRGVAGNLVLATPDSVLLRIGSQMMTVPAPIRRMQISVGQNRVRGAGRGALIGFFVGGLVGATFASSDMPMAPVTGRPAWQVFQFGAIGAGAGMLIGTAFGAKYLSDIWRDLGSH